jgi:hypothetical protein
MSASYNLVCEQATTFNFQFQIKNDATPWNLTNYTVEMTVRPYVGATTSILAATNSNGLIAVDGPNGRVTVTVPASTTTGFVPNRYVYDLVFDSGTVVTRVLEGQFTVTGAVTT